MQSANFSSAYRRDIPASQLHNGELANILAPAREWSHYFGQLLHDRLSDPRPELSSPETLDNINQSFSEYSQWMLTDFTELEKNVVDTQMTAADPTDAFRASNELNFHRLNNIMKPMWLPVICPEMFDYPVDLKRSVTDVIPLIQDGLALSALSLYAERGVTATPSANYAYFADDYSQGRSCVEGIMSEFDAAIILLEVARRNPRVVVLPAPMQFERADKTTNTDFVIVSGDGRAVGAQIKSSVKQADLERYDKDRVVLIDTRIDLGDELAVRTKSQSSNKNRVAWAGIICAQRVQATPVHGRQANRAMLNYHGGERSIAVRKMLARRLLAGIRPRTSEAVKIVGDRVLANL